MGQVDKQHLEQIKHFLTQKEASRKAYLKKLFHEAEVDAQKIIAMIIEKYRPQKIYQWGSLLNEPLFAEYSDIDIAVEGIGPVETFFSLLGDAQKLTTFPVDIVQLEKVHPLHKESIIKKGELVYERK